MEINFKYCVLFILGIFYHFYGRDYPFDPQNKFKIKFNVAIYCRHKIYIKIYIKDP